MNLKYANYGDVLAIPFFALLTWYFYTIPIKTTLEWVLFFFSMAGLIADTLFSYLFLK